MMEEGQLLGVSPPPVPPDSAPQESHDITKESDGSPPPDQDTSQNGSSDPIYAQPELTKPPPATTDRLIYDDIHGFQNQLVIRCTHPLCDRYHHDFVIFPQGQVYALPQLPASKTVVDDLHRVEYSEIQPKTRSEVTSTEPACTAEQACVTGIS
jgi:hypothetical protein